jgi:hypothetical protein
MEIMREAIAEVEWQTFHKFWFGRGESTLKKVSNSSSNLKCHFGLLPKRTGRNIGHGILIPQNVEHCDGTDTLYVDTQCKHSNELLCNKAGVHRHA